jgi:hypothetical protein
VNFVPVTPRGGHPLWKEHLFDLPRTICFLGLYYTATYCMHCTDLPACGHGSCDMDGLNCTKQKFHIFSLSRAVWPLRCCDCYGCIYPSFLCSAKCFAMRCIKINNAIHACMRFWFNGDYHLACNFVSMIILPWISGTANKFCNLNQVGRHIAHLSTQIF